ncbi:MAG: ribosome bioproteinis GTPase [Bacteroidetes bacterium]|nr:MAG: ribosome bioproteinis GTPase [Bacteroidota bacterium]
MRKEALDYILVRSSVPIAIGRDLANNPCLKSPVSNLISQISHLKSVPREQRIVLHHTFTIMNGTVLRSTGSWYTVLLENRQRLECRIKGQFRIKGLNVKNTNPIAVGDHVEVETDERDGTGTIVKLYDRKNYIIRRSTNLSKQTHIIAANIDCAYVMATLIEPRTSTGFIDRFLVTAEAYSIPAGVIFNKRDLLDEELIDYVNQLVQLYESLGYACHFLSSFDKDGVEQLRAVMQGKVNLISGHSGVGKSTLINAIEPALDLRTGEISEAHNKGKHTTTFAEMFEMSGGSGNPGFIIDTPGIKEFGIIDVEKEELSHFFPEMRARFNQCKFDDCLHHHEPGCAVRKAVDEGHIALTRYDCYLGILTGEELKKEYED